MRKYEVREKRRVFQGFQSVDDYKVAFFDNADGSESHTINREVVEHGDAVGVLVWNRDANAFIFVRQFRAPMLRHDEPWLLEIVAGMIDKGEAPEESARREVEEEIGFQVEALVSLGEMYSSPGGLSEKHCLFFAEVSDAHRAGDGGGTDDHEDIEVVTMPVAEAFASLRAFEIRDAKSIIAMLRAADMGLVQS